MLLAQGSEGINWIARLPGDDGGVAEKGQGGEGLWWSHGGISGASSFERECDKAAKRVGNLFEAPPVAK